jgi:Transposase DDE domain group 1
VDQGILPFVVEATPRPMDLTAHAGLTLVSETMLALGLDQLVSDRLQLRERRRGDDEFDKVHAVVLIQAAGGECGEDVRVLARDAGLVRLVDRPLPSPDALHDFLAAFHDETQFTGRPAEGAWIPEEAPALRALASINTEVVHRATASTAPAGATLDLDATVIESHQREARPHDKGGRGYQPVAVLWAEQDLGVADQYRDGTVPAGMQTLDVARQALAALPARVRDRAFRGDSACDDESLLKFLVQTQVRFTISAEMTADLRQTGGRQAVPWTILEDRVTETVAVADVEFTPGRWPKHAAPLRYVALRFAAKQGQLFADDPKYLAVVSNRWELSAAELVRWHWEKAGTLEFTHDVTQNDLAAALPPSGKFGANAAWYRLTLLTYNVLTVLRRWALPDRFRHARPKRLRYEVFTLPAEILSHARQLTARLGVAPPTVDELVEARQRLRDLRVTIRAAAASTS